MRQNKIVDFQRLSGIRGEFRNKTIVHCHGVFDVLHAGHLAYFESAKKNGDLLVVTITADQFVNKGPGRPYFTGKVRSEMLAALQIIDFVAISHFPTAVPSIEALRPDFYVKGPDYKDKSKDVSGAIYLEEQAVESHGGRLVFTDDEAHSSSTLINRFFHQWSEEQQIAIDKVKLAGGLPLIEKMLDRIVNERVFLVGECIVDTYVFCQPENLSSKSPSISARYLYQEDYAGGTLAIANHLADFVKDVRLFTTHGGESYFNQILKDKMDHRVQIMAQELRNIPTPRKTRYIAVDRSQRMFEITDLRADQWLSNSSSDFCAALKKNHSPDQVAILADFGHGLFEGDVLNCVGELAGFVGLNVQTNSSNFGFNPYTKHKKFSYLSIDTREVRVAYHDRLTHPLDLARRLHSDAQSKNSSCAMTLGSNGSYFFPTGSSQELFSPALTDTVVDTTGAGDAFFALTTMLVKVGCPPDLVPFLGNVFAGLKAKIMGNKSAVTKAQYLKALASILK